MNPSAALGAVLADELIRCGLREAVLAPGSRSAPLALALYDRAQAGDLRLHVRVDERSAAFLALGLAKAAGQPVAVLCTSGTAAAHLHAAVIEADESAVPLLVLTADRPPELRGTGANQTIDQARLYGPAVRWYAEIGVAEADATRGGPASGGYWRSVASRAWGLASGAAGGTPGPVHLNLPFRDPLLPGVAAPGAPEPDQFGYPVTAAPGAGPDGWPEALAGRPERRPWTRFALAAGGPAAPALALPWTERGLVVCGDGRYDAGPLLDLAAAACWPVLAEPSSGARRGPVALSAYPYLLAEPEFAAAHRPDVIVSAGRPGLSRGQLALLRSGGSVRHVVIAQGPGRWSDPARTATEVTASVALAGGPAGQPTGWLRSWLGADEAARRAVDALLDGEPALTEPRLARDLTAALPPGALLWVASSLPVRDLDQHAAPRGALRILANRGASGIDGMVSAAIGAALAHQRDGGGPAFAVLGDLALLHDAPGLLVGPGEPRPDLCLIIANNDGGGIFSTLEHAAYPGPFERVFGTPHGTTISQLAAAAGLPWRPLRRAEDLAGVVTDTGRGSGIMIAELRTERAGQAALREALAAAAAKAIAGQRG